MDSQAATSETRRTWQEVARDRGITLRLLGDLIGRPHSTMRAYSSGKRSTPQEVLWKLGRVLGEDVR